MSQIDSLYLSSPVDCLLVNTTDRGPEDLFHHVCGNGHEYDKSHSKRESNYNWSTSGHIRPGIPVPLSTMKTGIEEMRFAVILKLETEKIVQRLKNKILREWAEVHMRSFSIHK